MKQLKTIYAVATFMGCALFTGCNDDYLQKYPEDSLNEEAFFKTVTDLETYTNGFYGMFGASYGKRMAYGKIFMISILC